MGSCGRNVRWTYPSVWVQIGDACDDGMGAINRCHFSLVGALKCVNNDSNNNNKVDMDHISFGT